MTIEELVNQQRDAAETLCQIISQLYELEGRIMEIDCSNHYKENASHFQQAKSALGVLLANAVTDMFFFNSIGKKQQETAR